MPWLKAVVASRRNYWGYNARKGRSLELMAVKSTRSKVRTRTRTASQETGLRSGSSRREELIARGIFSTIYERPPPPVRRRKRPVP